MSRRYSRRTTVEAGTPQAWVAHWWKDEWADETMRICEIVYHQQRKHLLSGSYTTGRFRKIDEHYREWLIEKALEFRAGFNPFIVYGDMETAWYSTLHANLTNVSKWHFYHYCREHGINEKTESHIAWSTSSTDYLTEELGDSWVSDKYRQNQDVLLQDPERIILLLEKLLTGPTAEDIVEALKNPRLCQEYGCQQLRDARGYCKFHYRKQVELWGGRNAEKCIEPGCIDYGTTRGMCFAHYDRHRKRLIEQGEWEPQQPIDRTAPCNADGCEEPIGKHGGLGMCSVHYQEDVYARRGPCTVDGCDRLADGARGWCSLHWSRWNRLGTTELPKRSHAKDNPCSAEGCQRLVGPKGARGLCPLHYRQARRKEQQ